MSTPQRQENKYVSWLFRSNRKQAKLPHSYSAQWPLKGGLEIRGCYVERKNGSKKKR